ncbi:Baculoviral inhibition of apoptosis protein repeat protein [Cordyceps fumosorosea ARSEF 2679]|uniref:Baculoviral inhibition of apoptosis protein repeat protein n=1 Tax=Cordyceps fumosorosea (strain ARSEF 2679) TaxID=1081104 RepID=A0A167TQA1_CORFA|nr:Baculoviral inhibition of apoptosis protein repeat protein [Cordyceps fumosorosea ARSEF 2679]OAA60835.1 Baculoviral inhibition of apoptosis protein repeat protein [Cordyceps fumosorosea ARSEF 2679]
MADIEKYLTYDGRIASFRKTTKKRGSTAGRGAKPLNWPHKQITPASLATAGFYFNPSPENPDNCTCFFCQKGLDGWEAGDDPLIEHLTHASHCGWAITKAIEAEIEEFSKQDPTLPHMVEAREATFGSRWPHEGKDGWQCKTKQLVESGWVYTPTDESDDMATCMYCQLALDGWEPEDKPYDEHYKRSPNCAFFLLSSEPEPEPAPKKTARGKAARASKASRASTQSVQSVSTAASEAIAIEEAAEPEDSVLTTASMAQGKKPRAKKATAKAAKGGRKKTKKEATPVDDASDAEDEGEVLSKPPPVKSTRGRKRGSEAIDDSMMSTASVPATKKRAAKVRASAAESSIASEDTAVPDAPAPSKAKGGRQSKARKASEAVSIANTSIVSLCITAETFPDDDEIERQLEADLERQLTEDEFVYEYRRPVTQLDAKPASGTPPKSAAYRMLDPEPSEADEADVEGELKKLQNEMEVDGPVKELKVAKKGRKAAGTRKVSKQTKAKKKAKEPSPPPPSPSPPPPPPVQSIESEVEEDDHQSVVSTDTVVKNIDSVDSMTEKRGQTKIRESSVASEDSVDAISYMEPNETPAKDGLVPEETEQSPEPSPTPSPGPDAQLTSEAHHAADMNNDDDLLATDDDLQIAEDPVEAATSPIATSVAEPPSTPGQKISPASSAKQAAVSPSPSPQSSDAENRPPSSRPSTSTKRIALAPLAPTPSQMSPSKRNVIAGLQSTTPWSAANLDAIFGTPKVGADKENGMERLLKQGKELSSPEKQMTVEEWIQFNAGEAEKKLKHECEQMVNLFENEGTRAMNVLESLSVE